MEAVQRERGRERASHRTGVSGRLFEARPDQRQQATTKGRA